MKEKILLKDTLFSASKVRKIASEIQAVYDDFTQEAFESAVLSRFGELELKERIYHIRDMLTLFLPNDFEHATKILLASLPQELDRTKTDNDFGDFIYAPYGEFIAYHGCCANYVYFSLGALREITKRFSVEYAIRDFINAFPEETSQMLEECALSPHYHERRLASEGLRPKLPWAKKIVLDHKKPLLFLEHLYTDKTRFVTRSVANHLNDLSKIDPALVCQTLERWKVSGKQNSKEMDYILRHALRTLVKQGSKEALELLGYKSHGSFEVSEFELHDETVCVGASLGFRVSIQAKEALALMVDYIMHYQTKSGALSPKVHKLKKVTLKKDEVLTLHKKHLFKANMTTRTLYNGEHKVELQINGKSCGVKCFVLDGM